MIRARGSGTVVWGGRLKWVARMPARLGGAQRTGFETRADAERVLNQAIATGVVPPERTRRRRNLGTPSVILDPDDFAWARHMVSSLTRKQPHLRDDIEAEAMLALHLASLDFRPGETHFRSYAAMKIRGAAVDYLRTQNRSIRNVESCKEPERRRAARIVVLTDYQWGRLATANAPGPEELIDEHRQRQHLARAMGALPEREAAMVRMHVIDEIEMKKIGAAFGVTESRVCQIINGALEKIAGRKILLRRSAA